MRATTPDGRAIGLVENVARVIEPVPDRRQRVRELRQMVGSPQFGRPLDDVREDGPVRASRLRSASTDGARIDPGSRPRSAARRWIDRIRTAPY